MPAQPPSVGIFVFNNCKIFLLVLRRRPQIKIDSLKAQIITKREKTEFVDNIKSIV